VLVTLQGVNPSYTDWELFRVVVILFIFNSVAIKVQLKGTQSLTANFPHVYVPMVLRNAVKNFEIPSSTSLKEDRVQP